ncbi:MAG: hypothetical protein M0Z75_09805 [Nitrospiraceae bacterium]|nr:hypothetical protein [Nitrospiraceae bacterium]MDA8090713.1 hypothetical protein [Nitrospiraceae bacterium]
MEEKIRTDTGIQINASVQETGNRIVITLGADAAGKCILHWGVSNYPHEPWRVPPRRCWPEGSRAFGSSAVQTPLEAKNNRITIEFEKPASARWLNFALFFPDEGRWDNNHGRDYRVEIPAPEILAAALVSGADSIAREIIEKEMGRQGWTLMHRFDLCYQLLDGIGGDGIEGLSLVYVWLRFSALRQLDWQRNYNTKPRELGHSMDRLTQKLAARYSGASPAEREIIRLIMTTLGRGSNAQRVRDEILQIMHRHHIKEVAGHFMEEWHQKLHNNTTPDDVVICEAYLEFLRSGGDLGRFYQALEDGGVTRRRLGSYERPITTDPDFIPHLKDALIADFERFLGILKEVHSGADLGIAMLNARHLLEPRMQSLLDFIWANQNSTEVVSLLEKSIEARRAISGEFTGPAHRVRDLLFLDIALEDFIRSVVEKSMGRLGPGQIIPAVGFSLENVCLTRDDKEFSLSLKLWRRLVQEENAAKSAREWSLLAESAVDRMQRAIGSFALQYQELLQPKAEYLGREFHASPWTVDLFTEEILRGRPAFALSLLLHAINPALRKDAELGDWQIISGGKAVGEVIVMKALREIQGRDFPRSGAVVAGTVSGDEEIPGWVSAIITPSVVDSLSHLAIRARNSGVLFATCFDPGKLEELKSYAGRLLMIEAQGANNISFREAALEETAAARERRFRASLARHGFTAYAIAMNDFTAQSVGYKSNNLKIVRDRLPEWIRMPRSAALPFGVFEKVLSDEINKQPASEYERLLQGLASGEAENALARIREAVLGLRPPDRLVMTLKTVMGDSGLPWPEDWDAAWQCIKRVWASKWNERAYLSRLSNGIRHEDLVMSVLVQEVVKADYSFVIHTANPFSGERQEVYAEVVLGLGESLAANYPGMALDFVCWKGKREPRTLSFPSKSAGLFGGGLIFRSDSNGEDLEGYAGAGLYDSFVLPPPQKNTLDYSETSLVWDKDFRNGLLTGIAELGKAVEEAMGPPQDIEGALSGGQYYIVQTRPQVGI